MGARQAKAGQHDALLSVLPMAACFGAFLGIINQDALPDFIRGKTQAQNPQASGKWSLLRPDLFSDGM